MQSLTRLASMRLTPASGRLTTTVSLGQPLARRLQSTFSLTDALSKEDFSTTELVSRNRPVSATYFTGNVVYNDILVGLDALVKCHIQDLNHPAFSNTQKTTQLMFELEKLKKMGFSVKDADPEIRKQFTEPFLALDVLSTKLGIKLREGQYYNLLYRLHWLLCLDPMPENIKIYLRFFMARSLDHHGQRTTRAKVDELGRAYAVGRRKEASAQVWLVKGEGHIYINGKPLADYFINAVPREAVIYPLQVARSLGQYNVWSKVRGSGTTGQSEALALGIAKALALYNPDLKSELDAQGLLKRDPRMVERKKTGQPKARKKYTWVKR
ncbi:37S ribosomal protein S9, mitochondrial [Dispira simplex]|nr:37S ribosomal protein S9, mitochondrial [Dispira simplex]